MSRVAYLRTLPALGLGNVARVGLYLTGLRTGLHPVQRLAAAPPRPPFFADPPGGSGLPVPNRSWQGTLRWYGWKDLPNDGSPPDWFASPFDDGATPDLTQPWWRISDFGGGDIKNLWELSRFAWAPAMATLAANGDRAALDRLNAWLASWSEANPPYRGPNWKCGQEASIRVIHLLASAMVLGQDHEPLPGLVELVHAHLQRIAPTVSYAVGQQNNHATSEGAALFAGGDFLSRAGIAQGRRWHRAGRRLLEDRATRLIERDGSFSQYSLNYHRLMLDACSFAEAWRRSAELPPFAARALERLGAATDWFDAMIDRESGDAPNLGYNDGAHLLPLTGTGYRDFRPSLQLASTLFRGRRAVAAAGAWDDQLRWLGIPIPEDGPPSATSRTFDDGGYHVLREGRAFAVLRYPRFHFRPSQADALHLDLWFAGRNLLRDAGTFSYNDRTGVGTALAGTGAHNTVQFDGRDQMPRIGRFLFSDWLEGRSVTPVHEANGATEAAAGYTDARGASHERTVRLDAAGFSCRDTIGGAFGSAVLHWRLIPGTYALEGNRLTGEWLDLTIEVDGASAELELVEALESRHYQRVTPLPCLEVRVDRPCTIVTRGSCKG